MSRSLPTRTLPAQPDLDHLRRQARDLLESFRAGDVCEVNAHFHRADPTTFALHDAQLVIARAYGFESWPKLKAFVDGATVASLILAVQTRNVEQVRALLKVRPELARMSSDNLQVLHHAVLTRSPEIVRLLIQHGADPREGVYPHRDATSALTIARERGYDEIVSVVEEEARRRPPAEQPPFPDIAAAEAVVRGDAEWLRTQHAAGALTNPITDKGGLLTIAAVKNRPEIVELLLDLGLDPNERTRVDEGDEVVFTSGMPLWHCAASGKHDIAQLLLRRGADPNAMVYASGTPLHQAYGRGDERMIELLQHRGGKPDLTIAGLYRRIDLAGHLLEAEPVSDPESFLWAAACGGDPEIVRMALTKVDWAREDARWFRILEQPLRMWNHGTGDWCRSHEPRGTYVECLRLVLSRCDANVTGRTHFGLTILHSVAGSRGHVTAADRAAFATALLDAGARLDVRDELLKSTPLGWACRWGRPELVKLYLARGADRVEADAEPWATPRAWAAKMGHAQIPDLLG